jgi:alkylated DNA repair dioxygenase AlkB
MTTIKTTTAQKDIRLIENFIQSEEEERILLSNVFTNGEEEEESEEKGGCEEKRKKEQGKEGTLLSSWKVLSGRRVKTFGGTVNAQKTIGERLPNFLKDLCLRIENDERVKETFSLSSSSSSSLQQQQQQQVLRLNHVLVNEYQPNEGISSHQDGPLYASFVCVVSLARDEIVSFTPHEDFKDALKPFDVFVPRRSLLVFYGKSYDCYLHGIRGGGGRRILGSKREGDDDDEKKRISLTFRHVKNSLIPGKALSGALFGKRR